MITKQEHFSITTPGHDDICESLGALSALYPLERRPDLEPSTSSRRTTSRASATGRIRIIGGEAQTHAVDDVIGQIE